MLLSNKEKYTEDKYNNLDEIQENYVKWKRPNLQGFMLYDFIYNILEMIKL